MKPASLLLVLLVLSVAAGCSGESETPASPSEPIRRIVFEAETPLSHTEPVRVEQIGGASGGMALHVPDKSLPEDGSVAPARWRLSIGETGRFAVWLRTRWQDGCGNSLAVALNDEPPMQVGEDGTYGTWHWVKGGFWNLEAGDHELSLHWREDGLAIDQVLLTTDLESWPRGMLASTGDPARPTDTPHTDPPTAELPELQRDEPMPFRAAVGGSYRSGYEGALVRLGVPVDRLHGRELIDPEVLAEYDLICLSSPEAPRKQHIRALEGFVRAGGTLIAEFVGPADHLAPANEPDRLLAERNYRNSHHRLRTGCRIVPDESHFFESIQKKELWLASDVRCGRLAFEPAEGTDIELFGQVYEGRRRLGAAIMRRSFGMGRLYFLGAPLGMNSMWRGNDLDGVLRRLIIDAVDERCRLVYRDMPHDGGRRPGLLFADDFMAKTRAVGDSWTVESGRFTRWLLFRPNIQDAFSMHAEKPGSLSAVVNPHWKDYRVSASVKPQSGNAGVWTRLPDNSRVRLLLEGPRLVLQRVEEQHATELATAEVPEYPGWRRLSLFQRDGQLVGYLDGQRELAIPGDALGSPAGGFGLVVTSGKALFDDVAVRQVSALLPGTDRAPGEEGSCLARTSISSDSIEARNLYSQQWHLRPSPAGDGHIETSLPLYSKGLLLVDGEPLDRLSPGADPARALLPFEHRPRKSVMLRTGSWQDYVFSARLTDWYSNDNWAPQPRWSCDPDWQWPGAETRGTSVLWHKRKLRPPYAVAACVGAASVRWLRGSHYGRDLNLVLSGNGRDLDDGLTVRIMDGRRGCELWRGDKRLARAPGTGLPGGHSLHHIWWEIRAIVDPDRVRVFFDGRQVIDHALSEPLPRGQVGVWTRKNAISVGRVTISAEPPGQTAPRPTTVSNSPGTGADS